MLIREMKEVLAEELHGQLRLAVQRGVRDGLIGYAPDRDGQNGERAYRLTPAGREAASCPGEPAPAPQPPKVTPGPVPGSRRRAVLALLAGSRDGMTCPEIITAAGGTPSQGEQNRYNGALQAALSRRYVTRQREPRADARGRSRPAWVWQVTQEGADALTRAPSPQAPAPTSAPKAEYAWAAGAAGRHGKGESVHSIAVSLGVTSRTVKRALEARGVTIVPNSSVQPPWAAQAAQRYDAGESCRALARGYDVSVDRMRTVLKRAGVTLRRRKATGPAHAESTAPARAAIASPGTKGTATAPSPDARSPQLNFWQ
jgi:transposase